MVIKRQFVDSFKNNFLKEFLSIEPRISSQEYGWQDFTFLDTQLPPGEVPEHECPQHIITVPIRLPSSSLTVETIVNDQMRSVDFRLGDIIIHPAYTPRRIIFQSSAGAYSISLDPSLISHVGRDQFNPDCIELLPIARQEDPLLFQIASTINNELKSGNPFRTYIESLKTCMAAHLVKNYASNEYVFRDYSNGLSRQNLKVVIEYINDNLSEDISLKSLANLAGISQYYFGRLFKKSMGVSPCQYIMRQRIQKAKKLLSTKKTGIADIALACGFSHQSHLSRYFKKHTGTTPRRYQKSFY